MDFDGEEKKIRELFESGRLKKPPESLMKDYEEGVWKKIHGAGTGPGLGVGITLAGALALAFLLAFFFFIRPQFQTQESPTPAPALSVPAQPAGGQQAVPPPEKENAGAGGEFLPEAEIDELLEDLFILEMLGEDTEGLLPVPGTAL